MSILTKGDIIEFDYIEDLVFGTEDIYMDGRELVKAKLFVYLGRGFKEVTIEEHDSREYFYNISHRKTCWLYSYEIDSNVLVISCR